jgi:two-component system sensor histidine kinase KdpD
MPRTLDNLRDPRRRGGYLLAIGGTMLAVLLAELVQPLVGAGELSLVFMLVVLAVAAQTHAGPAVLTAVLCFLAYNFFFIAPRLTLYIGARQGVATVLLFLAAALLAGRLASKLGMQVQALRSAQRDAQARQQLSQQLAAAASEDDVVQAARAVFEQRLDAHAWVRLDTGNADVGPDLSVRPADAPSSETVEQYGWWFLPLRAGGRTLGSVALKLPEGDAAPGTARRHLVHTICDDIAQAILRTRLVADLQAERMASESARIRGTLLSSVSHDLRTPLAAIIGAAESLDAYGAQLPEDDRRALLATIAEEGQRLDRYIQNLLDMTRLEHAPLVPVREWIGADELIGSALRRLQRYRPGAKVQLHIAPDAGVLWVQPALVEQALFNVIDNAVSFSPAGEPVLVEVHADAQAMSIDVHDAGPGIPQAERERVFDMFYSAHRGDRGRRGTGLGLAICRGVVQAHGGTVQALPRTPHGTTLRMVLPLPHPLPLDAAQSNPLEQSA